MTSLANPCLDCGELTRNGQRCKPCEKAYNRLNPPRTKPHKLKRTTAQQRGYDGAWNRLSKRARMKQPFCSDCGATEELQADHLPVAWERKEKGLPIRLEDVDVVCAECNRKRGAARGKRARSESKAMKPSTRHRSTNDSR